MNPQSLKELCQKNEKSYQLLTIKLKEKPSKLIDELFKKYDTEVSLKIDCQSCGNCCKKLNPPFEEKDVKQLDIPNDKLHFDSLNQIYFLKIKPCCFLVQNSCTVYVNMPTACSDYPHLRRDHMKYRLKIVIANAEICPIVFEVLEQIKIEVFNQN